MIGNFKDLKEEQPVNLRMNYIDFILENQDYIDIEGVFNNPNLTIETIEKYYVFFRDLIIKRGWFVNNFDEEEEENKLSLLISENPNVSIQYLFEKLRDQPIINSTEVFFTRETVKHALKKKKITVEDYINLQTIPTYHTLFESNYLKNRFNQSLIDKLCYKVKLEEIEMYPEIFTDFHGSNLSINPNITLEFIQNHPEIPWDYSTLCRNSALTIQDLYTLKEHTIKTVIIEDNELETEEIEEWKYPEISCNPNLVWGEPLPEGIPNIVPNFVYCQVDFETLDISTLDLVQITYLCWNKKLPLKFITDNPNVGWDFPLFQNGNYPIEELIKVPNVIENSRALSHNPNVHWTDIKRYPQIHWNLQNMSWNHNNGPYIFHYQKTKITRWIKDKYYGYFHAMATWLAYEVKKSWWSPENKITSKLRESAFKVGKLKDWY